VSRWPELVSAALLGTERREPPSLDDLVAGDGPEERLLTAAGAIAVQRREGRRAVAAPALPPPAAEETLPPCPPVAAGRLELLLADRRTLLGEWLRALAARGCRAPEERLPDLLEAATATQALRDDVEAVLGERGRWLGALEARWAWAAPLPAAEEERAAVWATGERPQRRRLFTLLRAATPDEARRLLEDGWIDEAPEDRAWFVGALGNGLSPADEPLLERALDDRRQEVRAAAARLLVRLPSSFAQRMRERTLPLVRVEGGLRKRLSVTLPEEPDEAAVRDGIARKPPRGMGERAWSLVQLVGSTPLSAWAELDLSPKEAAKLRVKDELEAPLRAGFARAAELQRDPDWAAAFVEVEPRLAELVDADAAASVAVERLREGDLDLAERLPAPWPRDASVEAHELLVQLVRRGGDRRRPRLLAERIDPALADEAATRLDAVAETEILTLLTFRQAMHEELR
jgi:Family of unknown function (DUF5691)